MKKLIVLMLLMGCTDTEQARMFAYGNPARITCYSGGVVVYEGNSTGVVHATAQSDGWEFKEAKSGNLVRVSGTCVVRSKP